MRSISELIQLSLQVTSTAAFLLYLHVPSKVDPVRLSALLVQGIEPHAVQSITAYIGKEFFEAFTLQVLPFLKGVALARLNKPAEAQLSLTVAAHLHVKPRAGSRFPGGGHQHECWLQAGCPVGCCLLLFSGVQVTSTSWVLLRAKKTFAVVRRVQ